MGEGRRKTTDRGAGSAAFGMASCGYRACPVGGPSVVPPPRRTPLARLVSTVERRGPAPWACRHHWFGYRLPDAAITSVRRTPHNPPSPPTPAPLGGHGAHGMATPSTSTPSHRRNSTRPAGSSHRTSRPALRSRPPTARHASGTTSAVRTATTSSPRARACDEYHRETWLQARASG